MTFQSQICSHCGRGRYTNSMLGTAACSACGLGIAEGNYVVQDDLARLFASNMSFSTKPEPAPVPIPLTANYSVSAHYTPYYPYKPEQDQQQQEQANLRYATKWKLISEGVDPTGLLPEQLKLYENAQPDQQRRLVELWHISPPDYDSDMPGPSDYNSVQPTTMQQEEEAAQTRLFRNSMSVSSDTTGRASLSLSPPPLEQRGHLAEPYIVNGYESLAARDYYLDSLGELDSRGSYSPMGSSVGIKAYQQRLDPSYASKQWWRHGNEDGSRVNANEDVDSMEL